MKIREVVTVLTEMVRLGSNITRLGGSSLGVGSVGVGGAPDPNPDPDPDPDPISKSSSSDGPEVVGCGMPTRYHNSIVHTIVCTHTK